MTTEQNNQRQNAAGKLEELAKNKLVLKRSVFFIPGWTDETCVWERSAISFTNTLNISRRSALILILTNRPLS